MIVIRQPISRHLDKADWRERIGRGSVRMLRIGNLQKPFSRRLRAGGRALGLVRGPCPPERNISTIVEKTDSIPDMGRKQIV